jgi:hypothetical protein
MGFSTTNHPFWVPPFSGNLHILPHTVIAVASLGSKKHDQHTTELHSKKKHGIHGKRLHIYVGPF